MQSDSTFTDLGFRTNPLFKSVLADDAYWIYQKIKYKVLINKGDVKEI